MKKKVITLLLVFTLLLVLCACGKDTSTATESADVYTEEDTYTTEEYTEAETEADSTTAAATGKSYQTISNFSIVGKWKSVGSYGFGQAQPGAIVVFNGTNCNFYSPQDTYAFYRNGDNYELDCTSFMSTDTVSFTVKTVDENNIDVLHGGYTTELMRVE